MYIYGDGSYYYAHDHLYSPAALIDSNSYVVERYEYDAYGNCHVLEPYFIDDADDQSNYGNPYLFTGRRVDILDSGSLKIQYNRNRYYDQYTGRWLTHDPLGITPNPQQPNHFNTLSQYKDGINLYGYVNSYPTNKVDPMGLIPPMDPWPPGPWCKPSLPPRNLATAYDWWDIKRSSEGYILCMIPCKWRNDGRVGSRISSAGCYEASASVPLAPGCGPALAIGGILIEVSGPVELCNGPLIEGFKCQCRVRIWRPCKCKCCDLEHGVWTRKKKIRTTLIGYGEAVRRHGSLYCSCDPRLWKGGVSMAELLDDKFVCK